MRNFDRFGKEIKLTIDGDDTYKTFVGGLISLVAILGIGGYLLYLVIDFLTEKQIEISVIQMKYSSTAKKELQPHINSAFMEAFGIEADDFDPSYGSLRFETVVIYQETRKVINTIEHRKCNESYA